ncbi:MAG TPA: lysophospholipid acyltransferase family protein [Ktedonobacterales bacterium]|jgi:KDO2-lipid IV(A) lauroyltransferase
MTKLRAFRLAGAIVPFIPMWLAYPGARFVGMVIWAFHGHLRRRVERNLRHVPRLVSDPVALHRATRGVFEHMVLNYLDFLRGPHLTEKEVLAGWTTEDEELITQAIERGHGLIVVSAHFGNFEYGVSRLGAIGYHMTTPAERMQPEALYQWVCKTREHYNLRLLPADSRETLREMRNALKRNELVVVAADRYIIGSSIEVPFFGEPARLPTSPFALALKTGAPIVGSFSWRLGRGRSYGVVIPLDVQPESKDTEGDGGAATRARSEEATARAVGKYVEQLERLITRYPEQWVSTLAPIWDTGDAEDARETGEGQRVAASVAPAAANNQSARSTAVPSA